MCAALSITTWTAALRRAVAVVGLLILAACGGGEGGIGSGGSGSGISMMDGRVTGFGSVVVDGTEIEDARATTQVENADGSFSNTSLRLGQRIQVSSSGTTPGGATATTVITVQAAVVGPVNEVATDALQLRVAGQWVAVNLQAGNGPVTVFAGGYASLADVLPGDRVEVHGSAVYSASRAAYVVQATRVEKLTAAAGVVRVMGRVGAVDTVARSFQLNGLTVRYAQASITPATASVTTDQTVVVWGTLGTTGVPGLQASRVRVLTNVAQTGSASLTAGQVSGAVDTVDLATQTLQIGNVTVAYSGAALLPQGATPASGAYVTAIGNFASDGRLLATALRIRQQSTAETLTTVRLKGVISSFVDGSSFVVRGVPVDASGIDATRACPGITPGNGTWVEVVASQQSGTDVVKASSMTCAADPQTASSFAMRDLRGSVSAVDAVAGTFTLSGNLSAVTRLSPFTFGPGIPLFTQSVRWTDQTAWGAGVSASTMAVGGSVVVSGYLEAGVLVARSIRLNGTDDVDKYDVSSPVNGWLQYNKSFRSSQAQFTLDLPR